MIFFSGSVIHDDNKTMTWIVYFIRGLLGVLYHINFILGLYCLVMKMNENIIIFYFFLSLYILIFVFYVSIKEIISNIFLINFLFIFTNFLLVI